MNEKKREEGKKGGATNNTRGTTLFPSPPRHTSERVRAHMNMNTYIDTNFHMHL